MNDQNTRDQSDPLAAPAIPTPGNGRKAPVPKRKRPGPYRVPPRKDRHGLFILNTGDGKGKTTAAVGVLLRASGRGMSVGMLQFIKRLSDAGEHIAARKLGIEILPLGDGCTLGRSQLETGKALAVSGWQHCAKLLAEGTYDVLILDELTLPVHWGWIDEGDVLAAIAGRTPGTHVIITGRYASAALINGADLVTEMRMIKHPYQTENLRAQAGFDV